jgi:hypothetical protein
MRLDEVEKKLDEAWMRYDKALAMLTEIRRALFDATVTFYGEKREAGEKK